MKNFAKFIVVPRQVDRFILALTLLCLAAWAMVVWPLASFDYLLYVPRFGASDSVFGLAVFLGPFYAFSTGIADKRFSTMQKCILSLGIILALAVFVWTANICGVWNNQKNNQGPANHWRLVAIIFGSGLIMVLAIRRGGSTIANLISNTSKSGITRARILIAVAVVLGLFVVARNLVESFGVSFEFGFYLQDFAANSFSWQFRLLTVFTSIVAMIYPIRLMCHNRFGWWRELRLLFYTLALMPVLTLLGFAAEGFDWSIGIAPMLLIGSFWIVFVLIESQLKQESNIARQEKKGFRWNGRIPTHWSVLAIILILLPLGFVWNFDPRFLFGAKRKPDWTLARFSRKIERVPNDEIQMAMHGNSGIYLRCEFSESTKTDVFEPFKDELMITGVFITNSNLNIDYSHLPSYALIVQLEKGEISLGQLADIGRIRPQLKMVNTKVIDDSTRHRALQTSSFNWQVTEPGQLLLLLSSLNCSWTDLRVTCNLEELKSEEIELIQERRKTNGRVWISHHNKLETGSPSAKLRQLFWETMLTYDGENFIGFGNYEKFVGNDELALVLSSSESSRSFDPSVNIFSEIDTAENAVDNPLFFFDRHEESDSGESLNGKKIKFYCPLYNGVSELIASHPQIEILSLDNRWTGDDERVRFGSSNGRVEKYYDAGLPQSLEKLRRLSELYLPEQYIMSDDFLPSDFKFLRKLQLSSQAASLLGSQLGKSQTLESIIVLGVPDPLTLKELQRMPNLKELVVVDFVLDYLTLHASLDAAKTNLETQLPGVKIRVIDSDNYAEIIPQDFKDYQQHVRDMLREKHLGDLEPPKS